MGLNIRHITDDFVNHVLYGDYLLDDRSIFKGEEMDETLVFSYVREMTRYYESENVPDEVKRRVLRSDFFVIWHNYTISSDRDKYFLALGLKKLVCSAGDYGVLISDYDLKKMMDIEITGEGCLHDIILDYYKKNELLSGTGDNTSGDDGSPEVLPPEIINIFRTLPDYKSFINDCRKLHRPIQIVRCLINTPGLDFKRGNMTILHKHLKEIGLIKIGYSQFCRLIKKEQ